MKGLYSRYLKYRLRKCLKRFRFIAELPIALLMLLVLALAEAVYLFAVGVVWVFRKEAK